MERSYVARNLRKSISYKDVTKWPELNTELKRQSCSETAAIQVDNPDVFKNLLNCINVKSKPAYTIKTAEQLLILKLLSNNIKNSYRICIKNREIIVRNLISFLKESSAYHVHRYDIKSFYENIDRNSLLKKIRDDGILSRKSINLLELFFKELENSSVNGLPRGLGISAILSELSLKNLDTQLRNLDGIFVYERFVDDIILITNPGIPAKQSRSKIEDILPKNLCLHSNGSDKIHFGSVSKSSSEKGLKTSSFSYLGYRYTSHEQDHPNDKILEIKRRQVDIDIAKEKVEKIKTRLIKSFTSYYSSTHRSPKDYNLLISRLKFLSGNYNLIRESKSTYVKSGIYYNYKLINQESSLEELDRFLMSLLFSTKSSVSKRIQSCISIQKRREIAKFSFKNGHHQKKFRKFTDIELSNIKRAWR